MSNTSDINYYFLTQVYNYSVTLYNSYIDFFKVVIITIVWSMKRLKDELADNTPLYQEL